ncbi:MAG TPA: hypothetical protein VMH37_20005 [Candidatus Binataceae bacterium]|nr:hypothetical protein [Candidatus Binataceae bacterium]
MQKKKSKKAMSSKQMKKVKGRGNLTAAAQKRAMASTGAYGA